MDSTRDLQEGTPNDGNVAMRDSYCPLSECPAEVRLLTYSYVCTDQLLVHKFPGEDDHGASTRHRSSLYYRVSPVLGLLATCREVHDKALSLYINAIGSS